MMSKWAISVRAGHLPQRAERGPNLFREELWLFPVGEVTALVELIEVEELGVGSLSPAAWRLIALAGEDAHCNRDRDVLYPGSLLTQAANGRYWWTRPAV